MIRYGIMGGASIVSRFVAGLQASVNSHASAIATRQVEKSLQLADRLEISKVHTSYEALVQDDKLDIIYIQLWNQGHFEGEKLAIEHGKHVLLEKLFTLKASEAEILFQLAKSKEVFLMEAQKAVFLPVIQEVKQHLDAGEIGQVEWVDIQQNHPGSDSILWFDDVTVGGGALIGSPSYPLSILQYFFGIGFDSVNEYLIHENGKSDHIGQMMLTKGDQLMSSLIATSAEVFANGHMTYLNLPHESDFAFEIAHVESCLQAGRLTSSIMTPELTVSTVKLVEGLYQHYFNYKN